MIIDELSLNSFGKFKDEKINLDNGINIIYGNNEAGKTTIHKFIEGMFFGFFRPYTKRKLYSKDYNKYFPWNSDKYYGTLKYTVDGDKYRIDRNFLKGRDQVKVFDDKTGEEITHMYDYDKTSRLHAPASLHLKLNSVVYNNTINIGQLKCKTEGDLAKEVKDSLINLGGSLDEDISVENIIKDIDKKIDNIGTKERIKTSPYGKLAEEIMELEEDKKETIEVLNKIKDSQILINHIKGEIKDLNEEKLDLQEKMESIEGIRLYKRYNNAIKIKKGIENLEKEQLELKKYSHIDDSKYTEAISINSEINSLKERIADNDITLQELEEQVSDLNDTVKKYNYFENVNKGDIENLSNKFTLINDKEKEIDELNKKREILKSKVDNVDKGNLTDIREDFYKIEELEEKKRSLIYERRDDEINNIKVQIENENTRRSKINTINITSLSIAFITIIVGFIVDMKVSIVSPLFIILALIGYNKMKSINKKLDSFKKDLRDNREKRLDEKNRLSDIDKNIVMILNKYDCDNKTDLRRLMDQYSMDIGLISNNIEAINDLDKKIDDVKKVFDKYSGEITKYLNMANIDGGINTNNIKRLKDIFGIYNEDTNNINVLKGEISNIKDNNEHLNKRLMDKINELENILKENNAKNIKEFKENIDYKNKFLKIKGKLDGENKLFDSILNGDSLSLLKEKLTRYNVDDIQDVDFDMEKNKEVLEGINNSIVEKREELSKLEEKVKHYLSSVTPLAYLNEEIDRKSSLIKDYEDKLQSLKLVKTTINKLSKNIHREFAPKLNAKVSTLIGSITGDKYKKVKINEKINIKVSDENSGKLVNVNTLSSGTMDQLYFATRLGIINVIREDNNIPIILDDCFTQYDVKRLTNILKFLSKESLNRQIILFTCHERESKVFDKLNVKYNYVEV